MKFLTLLLSFLISITALHAQDIEADKAKNAIQQFIEKSSTIKTMTFHLSYKERMQGVLKHSIIDAKYMVSPFKLYLKQEKPKKGLEMLYVTGKNDNKAMINPAAFPWVTMNLSPFSSLIRAEGHFTIFETGFAYFADIAKDLLNNKAEHLFFQYNGTVQKDGKNLTSIALKAKEYKLFIYTVKSGETLRSIASKYKIAEYTLVELNSKIKDLNSVLTVGDKISVPYVYAPKIEILIDPASRLPYSISVYDQKGLFQFYMFTDVHLNVTFPSNAFESSNEGYNF